MEETTCEESNRRDAANTSREERYRVLVELAVDGILLGAHDGTITEVNACMCAMVGLPQERIVGRHISLLPFKHESLVQFPLRFDLLQKGEIVATERTFVRPDASEVVVEMRTKMMPDGSYQSIYRDITERKRAEEAMRLNSERADALLRLNQMTGATLQEITEFALEKAVQLTRSRIGYLAFLNDDESVLTMHAWSKSAMAMCAIANKPLQYPVASTGLWGEAVRQRRPVITNDYSVSPWARGCPEGHVAITRHMNIPVFAGSAIVLVAGVGNKAGEYDEDDVRQLTLLMEGMWRLIERKKAETALRESEERFRAMAETVPLAIHLSAGPDRVSEYVNPMFVKLFGYSLEDVPTLDLWWQRAYPDADYRLQVTGEWSRRIDQAAESHPTFAPVESRVTCKDGSHRIVSWGFIILDGKNYFYGLDLTARKQAESELQKMQKLQSVGTLAGGIAHDFNNVLMGLFGNISLAKGGLGAKHPSFRLLDEAEKSMARAVRLTKQLLTFAKGGAPITEDVSLETLVDEVVRFDLSGSNVRYQVCQVDGLWQVDVDKGQIQQVVSNLTINARQAMPNGGNLFFSLENVDFQGEVLPGLRQGKYVRMTVRDEGVGIDQKNIDRIFDPYFTTKQNGSGLGLAVTYSIISQHGGHIGVVSEPGRGTTFTLYLPASVSPRRAETGESRRAGSPPERPVRVLVMDDEEMILSVTARMLEPDGFVVAAARSGREAVEMYLQARASGTPFEAVIMDLTIPGGMGGCEAVKAILAGDPHARVIVSSGYAEDPVMANHAEYGFSGVLEKPYTRNRLLDVLAQVLK